jgi:Ca2+-binding RTX toxin-like protein
MAEIRGRITLDQGLDNTALAGDLQGSQFDPGIGGVTVQLIDVNGNVLATTVTDSSGNYAFTGLSAGQYAIKVPPSLGDAILARDNAVGPSAGDGGFDGTDEYRWDSDVFTTRFNGVSPANEGTSAFYDLTSNEVEPAISVSYGFYNGGSSLGPGVTLEGSASPNGIVDGEETGEFMPVGYNDSNAPTDGGGDLITEGDDVIFGNGGDDDIRAGGGDDFVSGGNDNDFIDGGAGNDNLNGDAGNDDIRGGDGNDGLFGGDGDDFLDGGTGDDILFGGGGNDDIRGGEGNDFLGGEGGSDQIVGGGGNDTILVDSAAAGAGDNIRGNEFGSVGDTTDTDVLDLRGAGPVTISQEADPNDPGATRGTVTFGDGSTLTFEGIETILQDPDGIVDGAETAQSMPVGFSDDQGDVITEGPASCSATVAMTRSPQAAVTISSRAAPATM